MNNNRNSTNATAVPQTMTSIEIAQVTGKQHKNVMRDIRNMEPAWEKITGLKFELSDYRDATGRKLPMYVLTKTQCLYVATKFNDEARARLVIRWEELERDRPVPVATVPPSEAPVPAYAEAPVPAGSPAGLSAPYVPCALTVPRHALSRRELLLLALDAEEENARLREENDTLRQRTASPEATYTATEIARLHGVDAQTLNEALCEIGLQTYAAGRWHINPRLAECGFTATKTAAVRRRDGSRELRPYMVWTESGHQFIDSIFTGARQTASRSLVARTDTTAADNRDG